MLETQEELERTVNSFFSIVLEELDEDRAASQREVIRHIPQVITKDHNLLLVKPIEMEEVEEAVKQMAKDKHLDLMDLLRIFSMHVGTG